MSIKQGHSSARGPTWVSGMDIVKFYFSIWVRWLLGTTNMALRDGGEQKRYPPVTKKSRGHKLGKLPEQQQTSAWSWGKADAFYWSLGERSSLLQNSRLSSSDGSSDEEEEEETYSRKYRKTPQPKMPMFNGTLSELGPFLFQFQKIAKIGRWTDKQKLDSLPACLCGKTITLIQTKHKYFKKQLWVTK